MKRLPVAAARALIDLDARGIGESRAAEQLAGAVALHNILVERRVAYLADEVGMGKTYVALAVVALFRHFHPEFRVLILAPRENIQEKWAKEWQNFVGNCFRTPDLRVKALNGRPARPFVKCRNLVELVRETGLDPDREFFARLSSFSLSLRDDWRAFRDQIRREIPWLPPDALDLRASKEAFKDQVAAAIGDALPTFDLVIVDEGHNLKHGFAKGVASRNRVLSLALGRGKARRVLFLSATPIEDSYRQLWNQLDVFGLGSAFPALADDALADEEKKRAASAFLIRRVTCLEAGGQPLTKNQYRRDWRGGGLRAHDEPIRIADPMQRLVVALVQKKVAELLGDARFGAHFQIGMLASFESFLETALPQSEEDATPFDDPEQAADDAERLGVDIPTINRLAVDFRTAFGRELPHPKMDALVDRLQGAWETGEKALVFVRRVASVREIKRRLDDLYDKWLLGTLRDRLPAGLHAKLGELFDRYQIERLGKRAAGEPGVETPTPAARIEDRVAEPCEDDPGGHETFFAWFFRGEGPPAVVSGATIQRRFKQRGAVYATFFEDNHAAYLLGARPGGVLAALCHRLELPESEVRELLRREAAYFPGRAVRLARLDFFEAYQGAAVSLLKDRAGPGQEIARAVWEERYLGIRRGEPRADFPEAARYLEIPTFWTGLRERPELRAAIWPEPDPTANAVQAFREQELRAQLLASAARLGHAFIDLYAVTIAGLGAFDPRALDDSEARIDDFLDLLEAQRRQGAAGPWRAFHELAAIAEQFDLILDVNAPEVRNVPLSEAARKFGGLLGRQQPVGGMYGQVNKTLVSQFRLPGYPLVLITTDLLQEGEDLHPFCSAVYHYGISWTPSAMEQRIGRIDRVHSATDRRLSAMKTMPAGDDLLQVYLPHLADTVEILQVRRILERMNRFLRLLHEGLGGQTGESSTLHVASEILGRLEPVERITHRLETAFPVRPEALDGDTAQFEGPTLLAEEAARRLLGIYAAEQATPRVIWDGPPRDGSLLGTAVLGRRQQPLRLVMASYGDFLTVRCYSPVGPVLVAGGEDEALNHDLARHARICAILDRRERTYDLTVEDEVLLPRDDSFDAERVFGLIGCVVAQADVLELDLLKRDRALAAFRPDLELEGTFAES
ncbi:MAG: DEAD/DEAH box helicase family protein [Candidatus Sericytochromatia bacterium]|nr:DEAD/DEAH box helicase family protein [Candidatus Tanganyikabacteria bacterium]